MPDLMTADPELLRIWDELSRSRMRGAMPPTQISGVDRMPETSVRSLTSPVGDFLSQYVSPTTAYKIDQAGQTASAMSPPAQFNRATDAVAKAIDKPSIPTLTNAGVQFGATVLNPSIIGKTLLGGYGAALADDLGIGDLMGTRAEAETAAQARARAAAAKAEGEAAAAKARAEADILKAKTDAEARAAAERKAEADAALERARKEKEQEEYNRAVKNAEGERDKALAKDRTFADTKVGQVYDASGGVAPFLAAITGGALTKTSPGGKSAVDKFVLPALEGFGGAFSVNNIPLLYNAFATPVTNPKRDAYEAYARELPPTHPRKAEWTNYARGLETANPVRVEAQKEMIEGMPWRIVGSAAEGVPAGIAGAYLPMVPKAVAQGTGALPGYLMAGWEKGMTARELAKTERLNASKTNAITQAEIDAALAEARIRAAARARDQEMARPAPPVPVQIQEPAAAAPVTTLESAAERARRYLNGR